MYVRMGDSRSAHTYDRMHPSRLRAPACIIQLMLTSQPVSVVCGVSSRIVSRIVGGWVMYDLSSACTSAQHQQASSVLYMKSTRRNGQECSHRSSITTRLQNHSQRQHSHSKSVTTDKQNHHTDTEDAMKQGRKEGRGCSYKAIRRTSMVLRPTCALGQALSRSSPSLHSVVQELKNRKSQPKVRSKRKPSQVNRIMLKI